MTDSLSRRARLWLEHGLLDVEFYSALRGAPFSDEEAAADFVDHGMAERLSPHPLLDYVSLPAEARQCWRLGKVQPLLRHLAGPDGVAVPVGPLAAGGASARAHMRQAARELGRERRGAEDHEAQIDWKSVAGGPRHAGRTAVVVVAAAVRPTVRLVRSVLERADGHPVEVRVVDPGSPPHVALGLQAALLEEPDVHVLRTTGEAAEATGVHAAVARSEADTIALLDPHLVVRRGWLTAVRGVLDDPDVAAVQPLLLRPDDTIEAAGLVLPDGAARPLPLLAGHPKEDARRLAGQALAALSPAALVLRAQDFVDVEGLDPRLAPEESLLDLGARLHRTRPGELRVSHEALVTRHRPPQDAPVDRPPATPIATDDGLLTRVGLETGRSGGELVVTSVRKAAGERRWSLKLPSTAGHWGDDWGDTHFAEALAAALRQQGQDVVTCRRGAHRTGPTHLDDVSLGIRGRYPVEPVEGTVNVLWVISHPDEVQPEELEGFDVVCAASTRWTPAGWSGRPVVPLLQASPFDPPQTPPPVTDHGVVFVGNGGDRERPLVRMALEAGVELAVYGRGWEHLPRGVWRGAYVPNQGLPDLYRRHGVVLADHWPDMARHGFIANRVFDAVASGARVLCDEVVGLHEVFDPRDVAIVRTPDEMASAAREPTRNEHDPDTARPALDFRDRARTLLAQVSAV